MMEIDFYVENSLVKQVVVWASICGLALLVLLVFLGKMPFWQFMLIGGVRTVIRLFAHKWNEERQ